MSEFVHGSNQTPDFNVEELNIKHVLGASNHSLGSRVAALFPIAARTSWFIALLTILAVISLMQVGVDVFPVNLQLSSATTGVTNSRSSIMFEYQVCLLFSSGDDEEAFPFPSMYRLLNAVKAELSQEKTKLDGVSARTRNSSKLQQSSDLSRAKLFVGTKNSSVACKMARDSLQDAGAELAGVSLTCQPPQQLAKALFRCGTAVLRGGYNYNELEGKLAKGILWEKLVVVNLDERDPAHSPPSLPRELWRPTIVTAFSSNHFAVGSLLLRSLGKAGRQAAAARQYNISIVIFTLEEFNTTLKDLLTCLVAELNNDYKIHTEVRHFDFLAHPPWMRINQEKGWNGGTGEYAWKVIITHSVLIERGFVIWSDAGNRFAYDGLIESLDYTRDNGFANRGTDGFVPEWVHPGMMRYFDYVVNSSRHVQNCDGSGVGFTLDKYETVARPWYDCSITRQCIAPDGSSRDNHRQDQAALTLLADMTNNACKGISEHVARHMDYYPTDYGGTNPTQCYRDPLYTGPIM